jgi:hypothetical protein
VLGSGRRHRALALPSFAQAQHSGPIDCGPPPHAKPQSRTGGESFPPLPLPATPLRRTEKKRPPTPPLLIGKMALGPIRFVNRGGKRVQYRDWMTDLDPVEQRMGGSAGVPGS